MCICVCICILLCILPLIVYLYMWLLVLLSETLGFSKSGPRAELWDGVVFSPLSNHLLVLGTAFEDHRARLICFPPTPHPPCNFNWEAFQITVHFACASERPKKGTLVCPRARFLSFDMPLGLFSVHFWRAMPSLKMCVLLW